MTDLQSLRWIYATLGAAIAKVPSTAVGTPPAWNRVVQLAGAELVTPALAWSLAEDRTLSPELADYFDAVLELSRLRAVDTGDALESLVVTLNAAGIVPVALKGAAGLVDALYPDAGMRLLQDIDLLVPHEVLAKAASTLEREGWEAQPASDRFHAEHHHLPIQIHAAWPVGVELHRSPLVSRLATLIDAGEMIGASTLHAFRGGTVRLPSPTHRVVHNIAHGQIVDDGYRRGMPYIRQLLELAMLRVRHDAEIDWDEVSRRFARIHGGGRTLRETLTLGEVLLGQPAPAGLRYDPGKVEARLARASASTIRQRAVRLRAIGARYAAAILFEPKRAAGLFNRKRLGRLVKAIRARS